MTRKPKNCSVNFYFSKGISVLIQTGQPLASACLRLPKNTAVRQRQETKKLQNGATDFKSRNADNSNFFHRIKCDSDSSFKIKCSRPVPLICLPIQMSQSSLMSGVKWFFQSPILPLRMNWRPLFGGNSASLLTNLKDSKKSWVSSIQIQPLFLAAKKWKPIIFGGKKVKRRYFSGVKKMYQECSKFFSKLCGRLWKI